MIIYQKIWQKTVSIYMQPFKYTLVENFVSTHGGCQGIYVIFTPFHVKLCPYDS